MAENICMTFIPCPFYDSSCYPGQKLFKSRNQLKSLCQVFLAGATLKRTVLHAARS